MESTIKIFANNEPSFMSHDLIQMLSRFEPSFFVLVSHFVRLLDLIILISLSIFKRRQMDI